MATIPKNLEALKELLYASYERKEASSPERLTRIGASGIGEECVRAIWFDWRGAYESKFSGRILRLFKTGHMQEDRVIQDLRDAGLSVWSHQEDGQQWTYVFADGHGVAKLDGVVKGVPGAEKTPHTLEIKSSNLKGFKEVEKLGVQHAKPMHYAQIQMGLLGSGMKDGLYIMICKDDENYYCERVKRDETAIKEIERKLDQLTRFDSPPPRITEKEDDWRCKFCDAKPVCWSKEPLRQNCRTCGYSSVEAEGNWACAKLNKILSQKEQLSGCDLWVSIL